LPELAERCAVLPELLEGGDSSDPDRAILNLQTACTLQELIAEGYLERIGHGTFKWTDKAPPKVLSKEVIDAKGVKPREAQKPGASAPDFSGLSGMESVLF
jgi:hypothetical protein